MRILPREENERFAIQHKYATKYVRTYFEMSKKALVGDDVKLLNELSNTNVGYHIPCYRNFTVLKSKYRKKDKT